MPSKMQMGKGNRMAQGFAMKKQAKKGTLLRLIKMIFRSYKWSFAIVFGCLILSAVAGSVSSAFLKNLIDALALKGITADEKFAKIIEIVSGMAAVFLVGCICSFIYTRVLAVVTQGFLHKVRCNLFDKMQNLPVKYFDTHSHGDIMSIYTNDTDALRQLISQSIPQIFSTIISLSFILFLMFYYSLYLTLLVFLTVIVMALVVKKIGGNSAKYFIKQQKSLGKCEGFIEEAMNGQKVIKVFTHEKETAKDFDKLNEELFEDVTKANTFANILMPIMGNIGYFLYVLLAFVGSLLVTLGAKNVSISGGDISLAVIIAFLPMSRQFTQSISLVSQQINSIFMGLAGADRIFTLMDAEKETDEGYVTLVNAKEDENGNLIECENRTGLWAWKHPHSADGTVTYTKLSGDIRMFEVDFGYVPEKIVLHDVTLYANPGQKVAFVGATGAGKTTITNLINRFYDIADGKIRYDGININKIKKADLRRSLGIVLQDVNLFTGTVMDNIRYGKLDATDEECIKAAKLANAHDFITRLPEGYNTMLTGDGANLSQGQRQLLSIARAAVKDAPVMILDEATSSIDTRTEQLVQQGTAKLMQGRTVFVIAHRLSTVKNSDVIMVLDKGRIIERGSHEELIKQKGKYYELYTGNFELE